MKVNLHFLLIITCLYAAFTVCASPLSGTFSFAGNLNAYTGTNGTGSKAPDFQTAASLVFLTPVVNPVPLPTGSFASPNIRVGDFVTNYGPMEISPVSATPITLFKVDGFTFTANAISLFGPFSPYTTLIIHATGIISNGNPADDSTATWVVTSTAPSGDFYFNSSLGANGIAPAIPALGVKLTGTKATFSWPTNAYFYTFSLQSTTNLSSPTNWTTLTNLPVVIGTNQVVSNITVGSGSQYFRLIH